MNSDARPFVPPKHRKQLGESPFRIRGSVYAGYVEAITKNVPGGMPTICAQIGHKASGDFLRDTIFLATSTYDIEPLMYLIPIIAGFNRTPIDKFIRDRSRAAADRDIVSTYRAQLRSASPEEMATRLPRIFTRYFEPCRADSMSVDAISSEMRFSGLPAFALNFYIWPNEGFVTGALESVGAKDVRFAWSTPLPDGELEGAALQSISCRLTWTNPTP